MTEKATVTGSSLSSTFFDASFAKQRVMAIIRGLPPEETVGLCESAWLAGLELVEVPIQSPDAVASLRAAADAASRRGRRIGVGTVTTPQQVKEALRAGAAFTVAPGFDPEVALASIEAGLPHLPGVASPTEVQRAVGFGFRWLKAFPAAQLSPAWIKALLAPFPDVCFVATGGVDGHNARDFLAAGARGVAVGSALGDPEQIALLSVL
jgi:2-dehydro-3-deoxyphosphogluconate aldolase/(4S)-4-hydroxy-2-oxoglutarate aldolase